MSRLAPLSEEPMMNEEENKEWSKKKWQTWRGWLKDQLSNFSLVFNKKSDLRILLSVLGCPLFPLSFQPKQPIVSSVSSSAQYIIQHFTATTGCRKLEGSVKNMYATGKVTMSMAADELGANATGAPHKGCFVMWQMLPDKWLIELVVAGHKVVAGSDGTVAWRHTPWLGAHAARGGVRPLRRAFQGLDPVAVSAVFSQAQYMGEKLIQGVNCFVLKLSADPTDLAGRSDNTAEMIKHVVFGYFSQRSGLLVYLEDSYLTRIQYPGCCPIYWETTMGTKIEDYRWVEGVMIAHSGHSNVIISRFGDNIRAGPAMVRMEEAWTIDDLAFNVPGLSMDCFIPPGDLHPALYISSTTDNARDQASPSRPSPPPIQVLLTDSAGRGVFATRKIGAGELIHTAKPIVSHPSLSTPTSVCYFCLRKITHRKASETSASFCGEECEKQSEVFYEVERQSDWLTYFDYCRTQGLKYPLLAKRLACMVISGGTTASVLDILQPAVLSSGMILQMEKEFLLLRNAFKEAPITDEQLAFLTKEWYIGVLARIRINAFRIELVGGSYEDLLSLAAASVEAEAAVGNAVYMLPSFYNHDCDPNAHIVWIENVDARVKALRDIEAGEELRICYIDASMDRDARQALLLEGFGFRCSCLRCSSGD
ncbi:Histone-lysine N-methyltransferase [Bertholletia excelsa]